MEYQYFIVCQRIVYMHFGLEFFDVKLRSLFTVVQKKSQKVRDKGGQR